MIVVGLVGGIGSGKSTVARHFVELGATAVDADRIGHDVLCRDDVRQEVKNRWGEGVFDENGWIDRSKLAKMVFSRLPDGKQSLNDLEAITHPRIGEVLQDRLARFRLGNVPIVVLDAPVLLKAGWDRFCDHLVFVECPWDQRLARVSTRGWDSNQLREREAAQLPLDDKRARCDAVINNSQDLQQTHLQIEQLFDLWTH